MTTNNQFKLLIIPIMVFANFSAFTQEKSISITTEIEINATKSEVYNLLKNLERYPEWSPFLVTDPNQKNSVTGNNGEVGSTFHWEGVDEKSKGFQTLSSLKRNDYIKFDCTMEIPFKGHPVFEYDIIEKDGAIVVAQHFNLHLSRFSYFMTKLFGVKKKMVETNKLGLERLKELIEKEND